MTGLADPRAHIARPVHSDLEPGPVVGDGVLNTLEVGQHVGADVRVEGVEVDGEEDARPGLEPVVQSGIDRGLAGCPSCGVVEAALAVPSAMPSSYWTA